MGLFLKVFELQNVELFLLGEFGIIFFDVLLLFFEEVNLVFQGNVLLLEFRILFDKFDFEFFIGGFSLFKFLHKVLNVAVFELNGLLEDLFGDISVRGVVAGQGDVLFHAGLSVKSEIGVLKIVLRCKIHEGWS